MYQVSAEQEPGGRTRKVDRRTSKRVKYDPPGHTSYACMQASPDPAHGARVQSTGRLEENRKNISASLRVSKILRFLVIFSGFEPQSACQNTGLQG